MQNQKNQFEHLLTAFQKHGILKDIIIIGSWAEYLYEKTGYVDYRPAIRTYDIDFFIPNIRKPVKPVDIPKILDDEGFAQILNTTNGLRKYVKTEEQIEVEFLVRELGVGQIKPYELPNLGVNAQGLRHMDIITRNTMVLKVNECTPIVPTPEAYIIHKLVINDKRGAKAKKDIEALLRYY